MDRDLMRRMKVAVERSVVRMPERMVKSRRSQSTDFSPKDMKSRDYWKGGWSTSWSGREINSTICRRSRTFMQARSARTRHTRFWQFLALDVRMEDVPGFASNPNRPYNSFCCFRIWYQNQWDYSVKREHLCTKWASFRCIGASR